MIQKKWHTIEPYGRNLMIVVSDEGEDGYKKIEKYLKISFSSQVAGASAFFLNIFDEDTSISYFTLIHVCPDSDPDEVAHEAVHASWKILSDAGVEMNAENNEAQAYLVGHLVRLVYKSIERYDRACEKKLRKGIESAEDSPVLKEEPEKHPIEKFGGDPVNEGNLDSSQV